MAELSYCVPLGIPHSKFLSWSESDQDKAIAWQLAQSEVCPSCGTRESDWVEEETGRMLDEPRLTPYAHRCHGCAERDKFRKSVPDENQGVHIIFRNREEVIAEEMKRHEATKSANIE